MCTFVFLHKLFRVQLRAKPTERKKAEKHIHNISIQFVCVIWASVNAYDY